MKSANLSALAFSSRILASCFPTFQKHLKQVQLTPKRRRLLARFVDAIVCEGDDNLPLALEIATSFIGKHIALYKLFEESVDSLCSSDYDSDADGILTRVSSEQLLNSITKDHGSLYPYILTVILGVAVAQESFETLKKQAEEEYEHYEFSSRLLTSVTVDLSTPAKIEKNEKMNSSSAVTPRRDSEGHLRVHSEANFQAARSLERFDFKASAPPGFAARSVPSFSLTDPIDKSRSRLGHRSVHSRDLQSKVLQPKTQKGFVLKQSAKNKSQAWKSRWMEVKDAAIFFFRDKNSLDLLGKIPLYLVTSARKTPKYGDRTFSISTVGRTFHLKAEQASEVNNWLFAIQCEVAFNLEDILSRDLHEERSALEGKDRWWKKSLDQSIADNSEEVSPFARALSKKSALTEVYISTSASVVSFTAVCNADQGHRASMEDTHLVVPSIAAEMGLPVSKDGSFFAVFDGHGGVEAARFAKLNLLKNVVYSEKSSESFDEAILKGVLKTDDDFIEWAKANEVYSGTTAIAAFLQKRTLTVMNVGDSRAVLCREGNALALSNDHKPDRPDEKLRIESAGGTVQVNRELNMMKLHRINPRLIEEMNIPQRLAESVGYLNVCRIMGELAMSRSIGDPEYKGCHQEEFWEQKFTGNLVIADPEIKTVVLGEDDDFLVLACDGLWDVMSNQDVVDFVSAEYLRASTAEKIARRLVKEALRLGSQDNISVIIVFFKE